MKIKSKKVAFVVAATLAFVSIGVYRYHKRKRQRKRTLVDRAVGMLLGIGIGDAKGIPFENLTYEEIRDLPDFKSMISTRFAKCCDKNPYIPDGYGPGKTTDDTQLSAAMVLALLDSGKYDLERIARRHIEAWKDSQLGWGGTKYAIQSIHEGKSPTESGNKRATGNGVLMKLCPLAMYYTHITNMKAKRKRFEVEQLCKMTHNTPSAIITAILFSEMAQRLYSYPTSLNSIRGRKDFLRWLISRALDLETFYLSSKHLEKSHRKSPKDNLSPESHEAYQKSITSVAPFLRNILTNFDQLSDDEVVVRISNGGTYFNVNSFTMVVALLLAESPGFGILERAAHIGGDCDSNASMLGGLIGGMLGQRFVEHEGYVKELEGSRMLFELGTRFGVLLQAVSEPQTVLARIASALLSL